MTLNVKNSSTHFSGTFSTSSTSYVDLLSTAGGSTISVTITKGAGTDILIRGAASCIQNATTDIVALAVHDGTSDTMIGKVSNYQTSYGLVAGERLFSGLPAGTYTFKLRVKVVSGNQVNFNNSNSAFIMAMEVSGGANAQATNALFPSTFATSSASYVDLLRGAGGATISVTLTKAAGTDILIQASCSCIQNASNDTITLGVNDGTTDHDVAETRVFSGGHSSAAGSKIISGLGAGTYTFKLRVKLASGNQCNFGTDNAATLMAMEIAP